MYEDELEEFETEYGLIGTDYDDYIQDSGIACALASGGDIEDIDDLIEQYENSSPSPMQRRGVANARPAYGFNPRFSRNRGQQASHHTLEITEYDGSEAPIDMQPRFQASMQVAGSSAYRTLTLNRHQYGTQYAPRPSYREHTQPMPPSAQHARQHAPNSLSTGHRLAPPVRHVDEQAPMEGRGKNPRNAHGVKLKPVSELSDIYRGLFKFGVFNAVQSQCYDTVMHTDENMAISAPTGSGKTVLFELAIIRMLIQAGGNSKSVKCIYVAPTKALCSEKCRDWTMKFAALGVNCCELTGDTVHLGKGVWGSARDATVIVTTGEKWDSLTRSWCDHGQILAQVQLFLVDEVHILNESRGSTLEVILSRMKLRGSSVRFVVVSATVPNIEDVASWIGHGTPNRSATIMQFGEEYRPCKLTKFVHGVQRKRDQNDFVFQKLLDYRLFNILRKHSVNKPTLVFCSTRKGVVATAQQVMKEYEAASQKKESLPWSRPTRIEQTFHDKVLQKLASCGIGIHHAGMSTEDRRATEDLFIRKLLRIVFATSTLAVGVNLPAHTVIIKGVKIFQNNTSQEYSDLDIMQMMGRAGRPQFDKEGVAIILCETELVAKYEALVHGQTVLESSLHLNLSEHINSEIGLGTITDLNTAKEWLHNSFLYRRIQKNPRYYAIGKDNNQTWQQRVDEMVTQSISKLQETQLVTYTDENTGQLCSTEYGDIMSKFYVRQSTMSLILKLPERASLREILEMISNAEEFSDIRLRGGERQTYNKMRTHNDIRYPIKKIEKSADKVFILIQAVLACINLADGEYKSGDNNPVLEAFSIFRHVSRIMKVVVEVAIVKKSGAQLKNGLELMRCLNAKAWEDRHFVLRQIDSIGEKSLQVLAEHGIATIADLQKQDPLRLDILLNRKTGIGHTIIAAVQQLPQYTMSITEKYMDGLKGQPVEVELEVQCGLVADSGAGAKQKKGKTKIIDMTAVLTLTSDLDFVDFRRIPTKALKDSKTFSINVTFTKPSQSITVLISSESYAGVTISEVYKPKISANNFPTMNTRPQTSTEILLEGLNDDPDFWNMGPDDEDSPAAKPEPDRTVKLPVKQQADHSDSNKQQAKGTSMSTAGKMHSRLGLKKRPDGKYECNHTCKDKTKCRHLCCKEGLDKPPAMSKKRVEAICVAAEEDHEGQTSTSPVSGPAQAIRAEDVTRPKPKPKTKPCDRPDVRFKHLESLHEQTRVKQNLKLPASRRIKLEDHWSGDANGSKPDSDFEIVHLSGSSPVATGLGKSGDSDSDDLPDPRDLLGACTGSGSTRAAAHSDASETNYSNSEADSLIRLAIIDNDLIPPSGQGKLNDQPDWLRDALGDGTVPDNDGSRGIDDVPVTPPRRAGKRPLRDSPTPLQLKRAKLGTCTSVSTFDTQAAEAAQRGTQLGLTHENKVKRDEPLFLDESTDDEGPMDTDFHRADTRSAELANLSTYQGEGFSLDLNIFDVVPDVPSSSTLPSSNDTGVQDDSRRPSESKGKKVIASTDVAETLQPREYWDDEPDVSPCYQSAFEELEAWLQSDAVEIVQED